MNADGEVAWNDVERLIDDLIVNGADGIVVTGTTGETSTLTDAEKIKLVEVGKSVSGGRAKIITGGGSNETAHAMQLYKASEKAGADGIMIGRAAQGRPWIFREIAHELATGTPAEAPPTLQVRDWLVEHLHEHHHLYGERSGVRSARKHIGWYVRALPGGDALRGRINRIEDSATQWREVADFFEELATRMDRLPHPAAAGARSDEPQAQETGA